MKQFQKIAKLDKNTIEIGDSQTVSMFLAHVFNYGDPRGRTTPI